MKSDSIFELENLSVKVDGVASMTQALRDCFVEGVNAPQTYNDAMDLLSLLMFDVKNELNSIVQNVYKEK